MSQPGAPGAVSRVELDRLASLFDRFEFALDPDSVEAQEAERLFNQEVERIYQEKVSVNYRGLSLETFRSAVRTQCRRRLRR